MPQSSYSPSPKAVTKETIIENPTEETPQALKARIKQRAAEYLSCHPGDDEAGNNNCQHPMRLLVWNHPVAANYSMELIESFLPIIEYRMNLMSTADELLQRFGLLPPDGKSCKQFDLEAFRRQCDDAIWRKIWDIGTVIRESGRGFVLSAPDVETQGHHFYKAEEYLSIAFLNSGMELDGIRNVLAGEADRVERDSGMMKKRRRTRAR